MVWWEHLENVKYEKADASDQVEQTEEMLLKEIKSQIDGIQIDSIDKMTKDQLATFIEKEFQTTDGKRLTYSKMKAKWDFYAFSLEAAMDFISDKLGDKKYTEEWIEDISTDGTWWWKSLDERLNEYGGVDATDDGKNIKIVMLLQKIMGITVDWYAGPETMANIIALLKWTTLEDIQVDWYDADNPYEYTKISTLISSEKKKDINIVLNKNQQNLVDNFSLIANGDWLYTRNGYTWYYSFSEDWVLYYSWKDHGNKKFIWPKENDWQVVISTNEIPTYLLKERMIKELWLENSDINGVYTRVWYKGMYAFWEDGILYYYDENNWKQNYNYTDNSRKVNAIFPKDLQEKMQEKNVLITLLGLTKSSDNIYTRAWKKGKYAFDNLWELYYVWIDAGKQKFTMKKGKREVVTSIPEEVKDINIT